MELTKMTPGVYLATEHDRRFIASLDDILYGDEETQSDLGRDIINAIRDVAVEMVSEDSDCEVGKLRIFIIQ